MVQVASPSSQGITTGDLLSAAYCEACERLVFVRALLEDPRHQTRRQGSAVARLLRQGLRGVEAKLQSLRPQVFGEETSQHSAQTLAGIGMAVAGLRQIHAHLGYLGTRWPLGTADLFVRKLVAEGTPVPVPTLCPTDHYDDRAEEVGAALRGRMRQVGLHIQPLAGQPPILTIPSMDLLDPLSWPTWLHTLAAAMVEMQGFTAQLHRPSSEDGDEGFRRRCVASVAARLVGEPTYAACAMHSLLARISGATGHSDLAMLAHASIPYAQPLGDGDEQPLGGYVTTLLQMQNSLGSAWGLVQRDREDVGDEGSWTDIAEFVRTGVPEPLLPTPTAIEALYAQLCDGRPINASPPDLPADFARQLQDGTDPERFYALVGHAEERPCSLATILAAGWRYKVRRTYTLCHEVMSGPDSWQSAFETLAAHVLERCALLQQSIEAAYVQQVFARWRDA